MGEITGGGRYEDLLPHTIELVLFGRSVLCLDLEKLIETKRAAGRMISKQSLSSKLFAIIVSMNRDAKPRLGPPSRNLT